MESESPNQDWFGLREGVVLADRYRIERPLSRGGMGAVFEATQLGLDRPVAVKVLLPALSRDARMQERFRREARSAAALRHPNIVQIYDYGISEHGPYIVMELVRGESLRQRFLHGLLKIERAVQIMEQACSALAAAHDAGIIHRDVKPDNILIEEQASGQPLVKVLDFGIAKLREAQINADADTNLTGANVVGSPNYMSPEQCMGLELDARSDIYSLGIVLYEMLTGRLPFTPSGAGPASVLMQHINAAPRRVSELRPEVSAAIESVVMQALAKERGLRHGTAAELAYALRLAHDDPASYETSFTSALTMSLEATYSTSLTPPAPPSLTIPGTSTLRRRLAILPLRNLTGEAEIEYLGFALADSVITQLACIKALIVRPSSAVERYRNQVVDPKVIGRELQVETILSGSYLKAGDVFRVNVQLVDVAHNEILWQERLDLKFDNVIALQDRICEELIQGLRLKLSTGEQEALKRDEPQHPLAYEFYLRGLAFPHTSEGHKQALEMLECAVGLDPAYAPAWAALAGRYLNARHYLRDDAMLHKAEAAAKKASELNPQSGAALFWLAVYYAERGDLKSGLATCKQLLQAAPNSEYAYQAMGHAYDYAGLPDIALTLFRKANEINPVAYPYMIGLIHYQKGDLAEARRQFEAQPDSERFPEIPYWLAVLDYLDGRKEEACAHLESILAQESESASASKMRGMTYALLCAIRGDKDESRRTIREILDSGVQLAGYSFYIPAQIYAQLGDTEQCLEMLRQAIKTGYGNYPFLMSDPLLAPVRAAEGFAEIAAAMQKLQAQLQLMLVTG
jgi:serine/threonine protein kinase/tetratricopeptide (TPR) repeat protein